MNNSGDATNLICISDLHINSTVALAPPSVNLDDGGTYHSSRGQRWLWECWLDFVEKVKSLEGRKVLLINGDLGELDVKRRSNQLVTTNKATIQALVVDTLAPLVDIVDSLIVIRGTMAHTGKSQWLEESIARQYDHAVHDKACDNASFYHFRGEIGGVKIDAAHHVSMGGLPWTAKNAANKLAYLATVAYAVDYKQPAPDYIYRAHNHRYADSGNNFDVKAILLPCWSLITEYGYRIGRELDLADIGGVINGELVRYKPKVGRVWALKI
jgi:hypothetical protein